MPTPLQMAQQQQLMGQPDPEAAAPQNLPGMLPDVQGGGFQPMPGSPQVSPQQGPQGPRGQQGQPPQGFAAFTNPAPGLISFGDVMDGKFKDETKPWKDVLIGGAQNFLPSIQRSATDVIKALTTPTETIEAMAGLVAGLMQKVVPGTQSEEPYADALFDYIQHTYTTVEGFKDAVENQPADVLMDAMSFILPGGAAVKGMSTAAKAAKLEKLAKIMMKAGKGMQKAGQAADITWAIPKGIGMVGKRLLPQNGISNWIMSKTLRTESGIAQTALDNHLIADMESLEKLRLKMNATWGRAEDLMDQASATGMKKDVLMLFGEFDDLWKEAAKSDEAIKEARQIDSYMRRVYAGQMAGPNKGKMSPRDLHDMKTHIHKRLETFFTKATQAPVKVEARLAVARTISGILEDLGKNMSEGAEKTAMQGISRDYGKAMKQWGEYKDLFKVLEAEVRGLTKESLLDIKPISALGHVATPKGMAAIAAFKVMHRPSVMSRVARLGHRITQEGGDASKLYQAFEITTPTRTAGASQQRRERAGFASPQGPPLGQVVGQLSQ